MTGFLLVMLLAAFLSTKQMPEMYFADKKPKVYSEKKIFKHEQKVLRRQEKKKYEYSKMPESGYMTIAEYEKKSRGSEKQNSKNFSAAASSGSKKILSPAHMLRLSIRSAGIQWSSPSLHSMIFVSSGTFAE